MAEWLWRLVQVPVQNFQILVREQGFESLLPHIFCELAMSTIQITIDLLEIWDHPYD